MPRHKVLLSITTPDPLLYGPDWPYLPKAALQANAQRLRASLQQSMPELAPYADDILGQNALRLFARP